MVVNHSFFCKARHIAAVYLDTNRGQTLFGIKNFVMDESGYWKYFEMPNMVFEQVKEQTKRPWWTQRMYFDIPTIEAFEALKENYELPCDLVAAHYIGDMGKYLVQGIEPELSETSHFVSSKMLMPKMILPKEFDPNTPMQGVFESGAVALSSFCFLSKKHFEAI